jgi:hypothetical protein
MPEKYLGQKKFSQRALRRKDIKEYEASTKRYGCIHKIRDILKLFAS